MAVETAGQAFDKAKEDADTVIETAKSAEQDTLDAVKGVQQTIAKATPAPTEFKEETTPSEIKDRLDWGEPALTIMDVRDRDAFNQERIMGAIFIPEGEIVSIAKQSMAAERSIYIYGADESVAKTAASQLSQAGYKKVSIITGGLAAWKAINGATEGTGQAAGLLDKGTGKDSASLTGQNATP